mgnify:CR=1 FL=1
MIVGDPMNPKTKVGPLISEKAVQEIDRQVKESVALGAHVIVGGKRIIGKGFFYEPTIVANVKKGMPVYDEEVFGPVLPIISFKNEAEAVQLANDTRYGLGASIFTSDMQKAKRIIP